MHHSLHKQRRYILLNPIVFLLNNVILEFYSTNVTAMPGCHFGQDLFPPRANQDKVHGAHGDS